VAFVLAGPPGARLRLLEALTRRVDRAEGAEKERLAHLREVLLQATAAIDKAVQAQMNEASNLLRSLLEAPDLKAALNENLPLIDDTFMAVLNANIEAARRPGPSGRGTAPPESDQ